ncbi:MULTISPECIES: hypothetical protein [unclassified Pseudomonas]|uniref:hypothetical protein n=1 Tax=unclassified Pseudomonas TaxID=196821 RepID=UPI000C88C724|nr:MULTISPECIES: hypothetical protein [unclassified Pseudomonas]PMZ90970.1 hypothetical protein C1X61_07030 [Pseudomonas sp. FW215-T2]PNA13799.1 hypothetical protein C1X62_09380 [Pseudomonas sp. FW215-R3]PNB36911.1 hypothetical protein C1X63_15580 [Pseudomonas sp. FW305-131]
MKSALSLLPAIALVVLAGVHFVPQTSATQVAQRKPHYLQLQKAPQLAVTSDRHSLVSQEIGQENILVPAPSAERLVF